MAIDLTDYIPHAAIVAFATVAAWVFRDHVQRDDDRFKAYTSTVDGISDKLDRAIEAQAKNHAEILRIMLERKNV